MGIVTLKVNGIEARVDESWTLLEALRFLGVEIPTLCHHDGLTPYGVCRLCMVEIEEKSGTKLVTSCLYPVKEGIVVKTHTDRVVKGRRMLVELMLARCPNSKTLQDLASKMGIENIRFKMKNEDCILCGLCVRLCKEQMMSGAIGFIGRGEKREVVTPFRTKSEICRNCGACMYVCPVVELPCRGYNPQGELCNSCLRVVPECADEYGQIMCYLESCGSCVKKGEMNELVKT
ncbi:MAG: 2Fe-2S iron-sulfur cluster-binding protein [Candidatus Bathyarchaeota archaeon]|nr:2Fe-2S iron-sulfur cluster-binding protein [Candidatus Bathyarchaeota archaeon]